MAIYSLVGGGRIEGLVFQDWFGAVGPDEHG